MSKLQGIAYSSLRAGKNYSLTNFGERYDFTIIDIVSSDEFKLKDIHTLEIYFMSDLIRYGRGDDFGIWEYEKS